LGTVAPAQESAWREAAQAVEAALAARMNWPTGPAQLGQLVVEVLVRPEEPWLFSATLRSRDRGPLPGGVWPLVAPEGVPSRSWAKLEELCWALGRFPRPGDQVLELGAAPGGATRALLDRGARVVAVDPVAFAVPDALAHRFVRCEKPVELLQRGDLPDGVRWLVVDISQAAPRVVNQIRRIVPRYRRTLRGVLLTLKLPTWELVERWPTWQRQLRELGLSDVQAGHLPSFRQELGVWGRF
jgi:23S rRNA (cytidine2498-2'-O)-methyltransferase